MSVGQVGDAILTGLAVIATGAVLLFVTFLVVVAAIWVGHRIVDRVFGECDDCRTSRRRREQEERDRLAEVEHIIRQHDRESRDAGWSR